MTLKLGSDVALFTCDACGKAATMDIGKGRPGNWSRLELDSPIDRISHDLCDVCTQKIKTLLKRIAILEAALKPFADYADHTRTIPHNYILTDGSNLAKRQLIMGDCYKAAEALR